MELKSQKSRNRSWVTVTLAVLLIVAVGFIVWQNFIKSDLNNLSDTVQTDQSRKTQPAATDKQAGALPDMIEYGNGVAIAMQSDLSKLTNAPVSFKSYLNGLLEPAATASTDDGCTFEITVKKIYKQRYALGGLRSTGPDCGGGAAVLWGDEEGSWKKLAGTQEQSFGCANLIKYKVPSVIAGTTCIDDSSPEGRPYTQE